MSPVKPLILQFRLYNRNTYNSNNRQYKAIKIVLENSNETYT